METGQHSIAAAAVALVFGLQLVGSAQAATCKDELDRFGRRLHSSSIAKTEPGTFDELVRQAEETAELRDEEQCLQSVGELNAALPEESGVQPVSSENTTAGADSETGKNPRRPAAPVLLIADGDRTNDTSAESAPSDDNGTQNDAGEEDEKNADD